MQHRQVIERSRANRNDDAKALIRGPSEKEFDEASEALVALVAFNARAAGRGGPGQRGLRGSARLDRRRAARRAGHGRGLAITRTITGTLGGEPAYAAAIAESLKAQARQLVDAVAVFRLEPTAR